MENYRTIQGNNQMNITGYSQQNNILGKTISNQKPNMINNPYFNEMLANNNNNNINLNNMNINSMNNINNMNMINQNNMIINQNQNQNKSLSYLNHKNMKINGIFPNTMANNTIKLNPYDNSSKQGNNIISYSQKLKEQKGDISERMNNNFNNNNNNNLNIDIINPNNNEKNNNNVFTNMSGSNNNNGLNMNNNFNINNEIFKKMNASNNMDKNSNNNNNFLNIMNNNNKIFNNINNNDINNNDINNNMNANSKIFNNMNINSNINNMNNNNLNVNNSFNNMNNNMNNNDMNNNMNFNNMNNNNINNNNNNMNNNFNMANNNMNLLDNNNNNNIMNPQNNINNNNDQNKLNDICNKTVVINSVYYPYIESEATRYINDLLKNMDSFGEIIKNKIEQEKVSSPNKFISISEALSSNFSDELKKKDYYVLSSLKFALESQGCTCEIEREYANSENEKKEFYTAMQFITNGMYKLKKYILTFDFGNEKNNTMLNNIMVQNSFNEKLKFELKKLLNIKSASKNIIIGNPRAGPYIVSAIIKQSNFNELNEIDLLNSLKNNIDFNSIQKVQKTILLNGCKLNRIMLDDLGDNFNNYGQNEKRGGKDYIPPLGWMGYGLRVLDRYDHGNNDWIDYDNNPNEWAVAYHGMGIGLNGDINNNNLQFKKSKDIYHDGKSVGEGVYMTQDPNIMEQYSSEYELQGKKYKLGIMCRIMPKSIRSPENGKEYWVINGTENEVRPYRILIKEMV